MKDILMKISKRDPIMNELVSEDISVSECFKGSKEILDDIIKRFDNELRTKVSGAYTITIRSPYLTCDEAFYIFSNKSTTNVDNIIEIDSRIKRDKLTFQD